MAAESLAYSQLKLPLRSRIQGRFASPTKVTNPEVVAASFAPRAIEVDAGVPPSHPNQLLLHLAAVTEPAPTVHGRGGDGFETEFDNQAALEDWYSVAYAWARQQGQSHEDAVRFAQTDVYGAPRSQAPRPESANNRAWAQKPLFSVFLPPEPRPVPPAAPAVEPPVTAPPAAEPVAVAIPVAEPAIQDVEPTPAALSPRSRMAGQVLLGGGLGTLGFLALAALSAPPRHDDSDSR